MSTTSKVSEIVERLKQQARDGWPGKVGEERADVLASFLAQRLPEYADALNLSQLQVLEAIERSRKVNAVNHLSLRVRRP